jgi:serine/threonine protein kinase
VYRRNDPNETEYIAKHVRQGSNELAIHDYLRTRQSHSPHVISLIEAVPSTTREWLILPKLHTIRDQWFMNAGGVAGLVRLGWGLIKGLAYLHEHKIAHRDIKPDNLVRDDNFVLKIIDFDNALEVMDENTEIDQYCGTEGWTAPEIGKQGGPTAMYSPIKADRWSCGRVLLRHIMVGKGDARLSIYANELMANDPDQRPSLVKWHKLSAAPLDAVSVLSDSAKEVVEVDKEGMKPPDAKRPRLG